jgi:alpha-glucosidase
MNTLLKYIILFGLTFLFLYGNLFAGKIETVSPDKNVKIIFELDNSGKPNYYVTFYGKNVISKSGLGIVLKGNDVLGMDMKALNQRVSTLDEVYKIYGGKSSSARNHYNETVVELQETDGLKRKLNIYFRAYDDGIAFRYEIPEQPNIRDIEILRESTKFNFSEKAVCWAMTTNTAGHNYNYEGKYLKYKINGFSPDKIISFPITIQGGNYYATLSEANIHDYPGMYLKKSNSEDYGFESILASSSSNPSISVKSTTPIRTPWRMMVIGNTPGALIESNLVLNLNEPLMIEDPSWIKPGKALWDWWAGWANFNADYSYGMNTTTMKDFIDFASNNGIEYMQIDATWYGSIDANTSFSENSNLKLTKSIPQLDLPYLANYANSKGVGLLLWMHWKHVDAQMDVAFPYYEQLGIKGVKIDFMDSDAQEMVNFYYRTVKKAAEHKLLVNFHGAYKPDGLRRTFPNLITREAVIGEEYSKWDNNPNAPRIIWYCLLPGW